MKEALVRGFTVVYKYQNLSCIMVIYRIFRDVLSKTSSPSDAIFVTVYNFVINKGSEYLPLPPPPSN
jgi:hypothetical protein